MGFVFFICTAWFILFWAIFSGVMKLIFGKGWKPSWEGPCEIDPIWNRIKRGKK